MGSGPKHTRTPWQTAGDCGATSFPCIYSAEGNKLAMVFRGDAEFIVRAVNAHDGLLEVLRKAVEAGTLLRMSCTDGTDVADVLDSFLPEARTALSNAERK